MSVFGVILVCIQSECGKIRTRITPNTFFTQLQFVEKDYYQQQFSKEMLFSSFGSWKYFLERCLVTLCFKVGLSYSKKVSFICFNESPLMKAPLFQLKIFFFSRYLNFCPDLFVGMYENGFIRKLRLISKFVTS